MKNVGPFIVTPIGEIIPDVILEKFEAKPPKGTPPPSDAMAPMVVTDNTTEDRDTTN